LETGTAPKHYIRIALTSPIKTASVEVGFKNDKNEVVLYVDAVNGNEKYNGELGFTKTTSPNRQEYTPLLKWNTPSSTQDQFFGYKLNGKVVVDKKSETASRYNFNKIELIGADTPILVDGWVDVDQRKFGNDLQVTFGNTNGRILGNFERRENYVDFDFGLTSNFHELANGKFAFNLDFDRDKYFSNKYVVVFGKDLNSQRNRIEFYHRYDYVLNENRTLSSLKIAQKFDAPVVPVNYNFNGDFNKNLVKYDLTVGYYKYTFGNKLTSKLNVKTPGNYDVDFGISLNTNNLKLTMTREIEGSKSKITNRLTTSAGTKLELNGHVGHVINAKNVDIKLDGVLVPLEKQEPY
ncbi:Apolipophorin, partial [Pseudolycoriella hygida]